MIRLFRRPDDTPMQFHLAGLSENDRKKYTDLITSNGGKVERDASLNVISFTSYKLCLNYQYVFNVEYIEDCVKYRTIFDIDKYFIGDKRFHIGCSMSKMVIQSKSCLLNQIKLLPCKEIVERTIEVQHMKNRKFNSLQENLRTNELENEKNPRDDLQKNIEMNRTEDEIKWNENDLNENIEQNGIENEINNISDNLNENIEENHMENETTNERDNLNENIETNQTETESIKNNENDLNQSSEPIQIENEIIRNDLNENMDTNQTENETMRNNRDDLIQNQETDEIENEAIRNNENDLDESSGTKQRENETIRKNRNDLNKNVRTNQTENEKMRSKRNDLIQNQETDEIESETIGNIQSDVQKYLEMNQIDKEAKINKEKNLKGKLEIKVETGKRRNDKENSKRNLEMDQRENLKPHISKSSQLSKSSKSAKSSKEFESLSESSDELENQEINKKNGRTHFGREVKRRYQNLLNSQDLKNWIDDINKDREKDKYGYPITHVCRTYNPWETKNLLNLIIKINAYECVYSEAFWKLVAQIKIVDRKRNGKSMHKHLLSVMRRIEQFKLKPEVKQKFIAERQKLNVT